MEKKIVLANEIAGIGDLKVFLVILSELRIKCVIRFDSPLRIIEEQWKMAQGDPYFQCLA
jgi:hypothetical protein